LSEAGSGPRRTTRGVIGLVAAFGTSALACVALLAASSSASGITITLATCAGGGTEFCFSPEAAATQTGALVTWTDQSGVGHQIAPCTPSACPGSPASTGNDTFNVFVAGNGHGSFTFTSAGTYFYYCTIHGYAAMHGSITVTGAATPPPSPSPTPRPTARPTPRPTSRPSMKPASPTPSHSTLPPPIATQPATPSPTAVATSDVAPSIGSTPSIPTPSPQDIAVVSSGTGPALPIAIVVALLVVAAGAGYVAIRRSRRQPG
jgi:plastocyanin